MSLKHFFTIFILLCVATFDTKAQSIRLGERIPEIDVASIYGSKLEYADKDLMCMVFINSKSTPCIEAIRNLDTSLLEIMNIVLVTSERIDHYDEILNRLDCRRFAIAHDVDGKTFKSFGINYVPYGVIYDTNRKRIEWFGPIQHLGGGTYCE